jgi:hypothetical protein
MGLAVVGLVLLSAAPARADRWEKVGEQSVRDRGERDEIRIGLFKGTYRWLKIRADERAIEFDRVIIVYANGDRQEVPIRRYLLPGQETYPIRLENAPRAVRSVVFYYKTARDGKKGRIRLYARD